MDKLQAAVGSVMVRPSSDQERSDGILGALKGVGQVLGSIVEYFR